MKHVFPTPLGSLARGLAAGALGSAVQTLFFDVSRRIHVEPAPAKGAFSPPEEAQRDESASETIARRFVMGMMARGPLDEEAKKRGAAVVHYATGAAFGAAWALTRESFPSLRGPLGVIGFSVATWMVGDNLLLPALHVSGPMSAYPLETHAYAWAAHLVFAAATAATYETLRPRTIALAGAALWAARADARLLSLLPRQARPLVHPLVKTAAKVRARQPMATVAQVVAAR
jgi:hypothetical protein